MTSLPTELRNALERAIQQARTGAEEGARQSLQALAVDRARPYDSMTPEQRALRNRLRAHGRQLGDEKAPSDAQEIDHLVREVAYQHWHRMIFARFLAENHLLIEPNSGVAVTMEECEELAREQGKDPWALAASFAQAMLPQIFRADEPALEVALPPETRQALHRSLADLPRRVFTADDALGWTYQFWQSAEKDAVNARVQSGEKITGETLPAVTQLFTEPYMVQFLLHNTIGAWHAAKTLSASSRNEASSEQELRDAVRLTREGGYDFPYLRYVREPQDGDAEEEPTGPWRPAAGSYDDWPRTARELTVLDPCCGSGHFLVEAFQLLVRLRIQEEGLALEDAVRAVIGENLFGLELDPRCTQIAAFNLALAAWKLVGSPIELPSMRIACSGLGPQTSKAKWLELAEEAARAGHMPGNRDLFESDDSLLSSSVRRGLEGLYELFEMAPELGSLIDPRSVGSDDDGTLFADLSANVTTLAPLFEAVLEREEADEETLERAVAARGMAEAARILLGPDGGYTLVVTNVPYLGRGAQPDWFKEWAETHYRVAKNDLATMFLERCLSFCSHGGTSSLVLPQNWLFLTSYKKLREKLLKAETWHAVARLGPQAFQTPMWDFNIQLLTISRGEVSHNSGGVLAGLDASEPRQPAEKAALLQKDEVKKVEQVQQLENPDAYVSFRNNSALKTLGEFGNCIQGILPADRGRLVRAFWEVDDNKDIWEFFQGSCDKTKHCNGWTQIFAYELFKRMYRFIGGRYQGLKAFGKPGVSVSKMNRLPVSVYSKKPYDGNSHAFVPHDSSLLLPIWTYMSAETFARDVRSIDQKLDVTNATINKIPFDLEHWKKVAREKYPHGLPEPYSDNPTQWIFHGHPCGSVVWDEETKWTAHGRLRTDETVLQVAVARLLGYRWPAERDESMELAEQQRAWVDACEDLLAYADQDGIVPIPALRGEPAAADRLLDLLRAAYGEEWSNEVLDALLQSVDQAGKTLDQWLRTKFFEQHCKLFHHRPFVWHIWDGHKDGFHALVNYHKLAGPDGAGRRTLETLTYTYLGAWIERQREAQQEDQEGADAKLAAALRLQEELQAILEGESPYDIFVRWKPLHEQPMGWEPDINDGVRLNIRPFMLAEDVGRKHAGVLRWKPNVKWSKDRGKEPQDLRPRDDYPWFWGCDPREHPEHRTDFGAGTADGVRAGQEFDGKRWNELHYTRAAKEAARARTERDESP
ncbi:MAG: Eco57I restriction-modification methylase domain-containing protein [Salinibacter sp.]